MGEKKRENAIHETTTVQCLKIKLQLGLYFD
jgi:hypothetical protein